MHYSDDRALETHMGFVYFFFKEFTQLIFFPTDPWGLNDHEYFHTGNDWLVLQNEFSSRGVFRIPGNHKYDTGNYINLGS